MEKQIRDCNSLFLYVLIPRLSQEFDESYIIDVGIVEMKYSSVGVVLIEPLIYDV